MNNQYNIASRQAIHTDNQVGVVLKAYGNGGELVVKLYDSFPEDFDTTLPLWVEIDSLPVPLYIAAFQNQGLSKAVIVFDDFTSAETASMLIGKKIFTPQIEPTMKRVSWDFLEGYSILDTTTGRRGEILEYIENKFNPLLRTNFSGTEYLLPISDRLISKLDNKNRSIEVTLAEGIFEL